MNEEIRSRFLKAVEIIQNTSQDSPGESPSNDEKLKFYALYKQATVGPCNSAKPAFWDVVARAKWDAWSNLGDLSAEEAMEEYVDELISFLKKFPDRPKAQDIIRSFQKSRAMMSNYAETTSQGGDLFEDASSTTNEPIARRESSGLAAVLPRPYSKTPSMLQQTAINSISVDERVRKLEVLVSSMNDRLQADSDRIWHKRKRIPILILILVLIILFRNRERLKQFFLSLL